MKKILILISLVASCSYAIPPSFNAYDDSRPRCANVKTIYGEQEQFCLDKDFLGQASRSNNHSAFWSFLSAEGRSGYTKNEDIEGGWLKLYNQSQDMRGHVIDFSAQGFSSFSLKGYNSTLKNGTILVGRFFMGGQTKYYAPNFAEQGNSISMKKYGYLYANNNFECYGEPCTKPRLFRENQGLDHVNLSTNFASLESWGGSIQHSNIVVEGVIQIQGSKFNFQNNTVWSNAEPLFSNTKLLIPAIQKHSALVNIAEGMLPDTESYNKDRMIQSTLYVKYSPNTVIDGNTFHLNHAQAGTYAIVLDHSPNVKITNNRFNGYAVPILMDDYSSIVDDYGNVIQSNQYTGPVVMQRNGKVLPKPNKEI